MSSSPTSPSGARPQDGSNVVEASKISLSPLNSSRSLSSNCQNPAPLHTSETAQVQESSEEISTGSDSFIKQQLQEKEQQSQHQMEEQQLHQQKVQEQQQLHPQEENSQVQEDNDRTLPKEGEDKESIRGPKDDDMDGPALSDSKKKNYCQKDQLKQADSSLDVSSPNRMTSYLVEPEPQHSMEQDNLSESLSLKNDKDSLNSAMQSTGDVVVASEKIDKSRDEIPADQQSSSSSNFSISVKQSSNTTHIEKDISIEKDSQSDEKDDRETSALSTQMPTASQGQSATQSALESSRPSSASNPMSSLQKVIESCKAKLGIEDENILQLNECGEEAEEEDEDEDILNEDSEDEILKDEEIKESASEESKKEKGSDGTNPKLPSSGGTGIVDQGNLSSSVHSGNDTDEKTTDEPLGSNKSPLQLQESDLDDSSNASKKMLESSLSNAGDKNSPTSKEANRTDVLLRAKETDVISSGRETLSIGSLSKLGDMSQNEETVEGTQAFDANRVNRVQALQFLHGEGISDASTKSTSSSQNEQSDSNSNSGIDPPVLVASVTSYIHSNSNSPIPSAEISEQTYKDDQRLQSDDVNKRISSNITDTKKDAVQIIDDTDLDMEVDCVEQQQVEEDVELDDEDDDGVLQIDLDDDTMEGEIDKEKECESIAGKNLYRMIDRQTNQVKDTSLPFQDSASSESSVQRLPLNLTSLLKSKTRKITMTQLKPSVTLSSSSSVSAAAASPLLVSCLLRPPSTATSSSVSSAPSGVFSSSTSIVASSTAPVGMFLGGQILPKSSLPAVLVIPNDSPSIATPLPLVYNSSSSSLSPRIDQNSIISLVNDSASENGYLEQGEPNRKNVDEADNSNIVGDSEVEDAEGSDVIMQDTEVFINLDNSDEEYQREGDGRIHNVDKTNQPPYKARPTSKPQGAGSEKTATHISSQTRPSLQR